MQEVRRVTVTDGGIPVMMVNEIEYIEGEVFGNIFGKDCIARINPKTGVVIGWIVMDDLLARANKHVNNPHTDNILNGIAWRHDKRTYLVSGKRWPSVFEVKLQPQPDADLGRVRRTCVPTHNIFRI